VEQRVIYSGGAVGVAPAGNGRWNFQVQSLRGRRGPSPGSWDSRVVQSVHRGWRWTPSLLGVLENELSHERENVPFKHSPDPKLHYWTGISILREKHALGPLNHRGAERSQNSDRISLRELLR
jgi:hypothetical protein